MKIDGDKLVVLNEKQKVCTLDPTTGENLDKRNSVTILYIVLPVTLIILLFIIFTRKKLGN
jgi:hypothetical protein